MPLSEPRLNDLAQETGFLPVTLEKVIRLGELLAADRPLLGAWRNPSSGEVEYDESWRCEVGVPRDRLDEVDEYLARLADRLGQKAIWRVRYGKGEGKAIEARPRE